MARTRLESLLSSGTMTVARNGKGRYGRTLAHIYVDGVSVAETLIAEGYGRPYGSGRKPWC